MQKRKLETVSRDLLNRRDSSARITFVKVERANRPSRPTRKLGKVKRASKFSSRTRRTPRHVENPVEYDPTALPIILHTFVGIIPMAGYI